MKIYLIGFMGAGKTSLGKKLAVELDLLFHDLDDMIELQEGCSIKELFPLKGEAYFRQAESYLLLNLQEQGIIATGGGIVIKPENREFLNLNDKITIWLNPGWEILNKRLLETDMRPLTEQLDQDQLYDLWQKRLPLYKDCADIVVNDPDPEKLLRSLKIYLKLKE